MDAAGFDVLTWRKGTTTQNPHPSMTRVLRLGGNVLFEEITNDPLLSSDDGWPMERIFKNEFGILSVSEIRELLTSRPSLTADCSGIMDSFYDLLRLSLWQTFFEFSSVSPNAFEVKGVVREGAFDKRLLKFLPGSFISYKDSNLLLKSRRGSYSFWDAANISHPLADWYLSVAPALRRLSPAADASLVAPLLAPTSELREDFDALRRAVDRANAALTTLRLTFNGHLSKQAIGFFDL